jgi:HK97 family phage major capsid protein
MIPRGAAGASAAYVGENVNIAATEPGLGMIQMSARKLAAIVPVSNELIRDSSPSADAWVRDDLVQALATREDLAFIRDDGTQYKPKGIRFWVDAAGLTAANVTVNITNTLADLKTSLRKFKQGRKGKIITPAWFMSTRTEQYLAHLVTGAPERYFFRDEMLTGKLFGYPYFVTDQIPDNLGAGADESELYLVDMFEAIIGENMALELAVSQEAAYDEGGTLRAAFSLDQTVLRAIARHDFALRYGRAAHILTGVKWS